MKLALHWRILIGLVLGLVAGLVANQVFGASTWSSLGVDDPAAYLAGAESEANESAGAPAAVARFVRNLNAFVGDLFLQCLRFIAIPIVIFSLVAGVSSLNDAAKLGRIGLKTVVIYLCTTAVAITIGLGLANLVKPGTFVSEAQRDSIVAQQMDNASSKVESAQKNKGEAKKTAWKFFIDIVPKNPFAALAGGNMLQIVFFALAIGVGLSLIPTELGAPITRWFEGMTLAVIKVVEIIMWFAPVAVFALLAKVMADMGLGVLQALLVYSVTVLAGLLLMVGIVYIGMIKLFTDVSVVRFLKAVSPAQLLAFSSSSSSATLPVTMDCVRSRLGVSEDVSSFVLPLGATVNMDGTALYQGVAALFIAQLFGVPLTFGDQLTIVLTATLASIGTAAVPSAGLVMLVIVLESVNMPAEVMTTGIAVIFGVDRILDMCRTTCNVTGDAMVATVVASTENEIMSSEEVAAARARAASTGIDESPKDG